MTSILNLPIRVDHDAERISTHNGGASCDFNGNEAQRREALRFYEQAPRMALSLKQAHDDMGCQCIAEPGPWLCHIHEVLRDAGVMSDGVVSSGGGT